MNRTLSVMIWFVWLRALIQPTSVCTKPPQPQSYLHYIRTLPVCSSGILLSGTRCASTLMWEMDKTQINITHACTSVYTHAHTSTKLYTHQVWEQQAPVKRRTSVRDCEKPWLTLIQFQNGRRLCRPTAHQYTHKPFICAEKTMDRVSDQSTYLEVKTHTTTSPTVCGWKGKETRAVAFSLWQEE